MSEEKGRVYTKEELDQIKKEYNQNEKMNWMMDMINSNTREIEKVQNTLHDGWDRKLWFNTITRNGIIWFFGAGVAAGIGYLFSTF